MLCKGQYITSTLYFVQSGTFTYFKDTFMIIDIGILKTRSFASLYYKNLPLISGNTLPNRINEK